MPRNEQPTSADQMIASSPFSPPPVATSATPEQNGVSTAIPIAATSATAAESDSLDTIENGLLMAVCLADRCTFGKWLVVFGVFVPMLSKWNKMRRWYRRTGSY